LGPAGATLASLARTAARATASRFARTAAAATLAELGRTPAAATLAELARTPARATPSRFTRTAAAATLPELGRMPAGTTLPGRGRTPFGTLRAALARAPDHRRRGDHGKPAHIGVGQARLQTELALHFLGDRGLLRTHQADDDPVRTGSTRSAGPVDVVGGVARWVVVHDQGYRIDVNTPSGYVGGHQGVHPAGPERRQGALALGLAAVAMDGGHLDAGSGQALRQTIGAPLRPAEHHGRAARRHYLSGDRQAVL